MVRIVARNPHRPFYLIQQPPTFKIIRGLDPCFWSYWAKRNDYSIGIANNCAVGGLVRVRGQITVVLFYLASEAIGRETFT